MEAKKFVNEKSEILANYFNLFIMKELTDTQLDHFLWDTLKEWDQLNIQDESVGSCKEEVFWHLLFELKNWSGNQILSNTSLQQLLTSSAMFLKDQGNKPAYCIGIRPVSAQ